MFWGDLTAILEEVLEEDVPLETLAVLLEVEGLLMLEELLDEEGPELLETEGPELLDMDGPELLVLGAELLALGEPEPLEPEPLA